MLADCYVWFGWSCNLPLEEATAKATAFAQKALEIDDMLSESHYALAQIKGALHWDWLGVEEEHKRAIELNPNNGLAHGENAWRLVSRGQFADAIVESKPFLQLDPVSYIPNMSMAWIYLLSRHYDEAITHWKKMAELEPNDTRIYRGLATVYERSGQYEEAIIARQKMMTLSGAPSGELEALYRAYRESGPNGYWRWLLEKSKEQHNPHPAYVAMYYGQLDDKDRAFAWLEKAYEQHDSPMFRLAVEPGWDPLRDDPRFRDMLQRMNLPEIAIHK